MNAMHSSLVLVLVTATACAQRIENLSQAVDVRNVWTPVIATANHSVVEVLVDGERRVLGTAIASDLVVTKYSELQPGQDRAGALACRRGNRRWQARLLGFDRPADLALLRVPDAALTAIHFRTDVPRTGSLLASPDGDGAPMGVGILSSQPYVHTRARAFLGVRFADAQGPAKLEEVVEHGAAKAAGLLAGDLVIGFDKHPIQSAQALRERIAACKPGDEVTVEVRRGDEQHSFVVRLGSNNTPVRSDQERIWGSLSAVRAGFARVLQHDTVLEPGDCGGPLVDLSGRAVGINIARAGRVETLALPAADVQRIVARLAKTRATDKR